MLCCEVGNRGKTENWQEGGVGGQNWNNFWVTSKGAVMYPNVKVYGVCFLCFRAVWVWLFENTIKIGVSAVLGHCFFVKALGAKSGVSKWSTSRSRNGPHGGSNSWRPWWTTYWKKNFSFKVFFVCVCFLQEISCCCFDVCFGGFVDHLLTQGGARSGPLIDPTAHLNMCIYIYIHMADTSPSGRALFLEADFSQRLYKKRIFSPRTFLTLIRFFLDFFDALDMKSGILAAVWGTFLGTDRLKSLFL